MGNFLNDKYVQHFKVEPQLNLINACVRKTCVLT